MPSKIEGSYQLERNENMDEYFSKVGMPYLVRKAILLFSPTVDVKKKTEGASVTESEWNIAIHEAMKTVEMNFKFGEEFTETLPMGSFQTTATLDSDDVIKFQSKTSKGDLTRTFTFSDDCLVVHFHNTTLDVQGKRHFKRLS